MQIGIDSFVSIVTDPETGVDITPVQRVQHLLEEVERADQVGLDTYGIGEHHRQEYMDSAPAILLAAAAARTTDIRLNSAVTVLSASDPVRVFQEFATLDLVSQGRIDMVVGRGSFTEAFPLFGLDLADYDSLFAEKLDLLLRIRDNAEVTWSGRHRPPLNRQGVYPRPLQNPLPIWVGVGGTPESFVRAGTLGLPLMVAIIGGQPARFRPLIDLYRQAGQRAGHAPEQLTVGLHCFGFVGDSLQQAADDFYPGWAQMFTKIGKERGFGPPVRAQYDAMLGPDGAFLIGDPQTVATKILRISDDLGGISRISLQMTNVRLAHANLLHGIELLGTRVAPLVRAAVGA
ncbi:MAG: 3,6-diketocamphane 1,6 monooxygenase [Frankiales bacterium]|nr:3,6-diketocamphane 1,6 monooxygenase [Frankiales bacterium]